MLLYIIIKFVCGADDLQEGAGNCIGLACGSRCQSRLVSTCAPHAHKGGACSTHSQSSVHTPTHVWATQQACMLQDMSINGLLPLCREKCHWQSNFF
jgi:hypothetical protein